MDAFLDFISTQERGLIEEAMSFGTTGKFSDCMQQKIFNVLSRFGCRQVPRLGNLMSCIEDIAKYEFVTKPAAAIIAVHSGILRAHQKFWKDQSVSTISRMYTNFTVTPKKVNELLLQPEFMSENEERVYGYLVCMIGNVNINEGRNFLRFVTGSSVCSTKGITISFNTLSGLARRPIANTCDCMLELSSTL